MAYSIPLDAQSVLTTADGRLAHLPVLDGLRGVAIACVLAVHANIPGAMGGWIGVDLFFVLSGFLITSLLLREKERYGSINFLRFYLRRALRLLPVTIAFLAVTWLCALTLGQSSDLRELTGSSRAILFYYFNWHIASLGNAPGNVSQYIGHLWSLSVEEQFYLVWPLIVAGLTSFQPRRRWLLVAAVAGTLIPAVVRFVLVYGSTLPLNDAGRTHRIYMGTDARADALLIGCLLGILVACRPRLDGRLQTRALQAGGIVAIVVLGWHFMAVSTVEQAYLYRYGGFSLVAVANAVLLASLVWAPPPLISSAFSLRPLRWLGRISYGTYVWHWPIAWWFRKQMASSHPWLTIALTLCTGVAVGALSYYALERPFLRLKSRLGYRRSIGERAIGERVTVGAHAAATRAELEISSRPVAA